MKFTFAFPKNKQKRSTSRQVFSTMKSLSLSLITSMQSISEPSSSVTVASLASNPNFSPVEDYK